MDVNGGRVFDRKYPESSTHYPSANIRDLNINVPYTITPNNANVNVRVRVEVWESDNGQLFAGGDDHLGTMTRDLNIANAWGLRDRRTGCSAPAISVRGSTIWTGPLSPKSPPGRRSISGAYKIEVLPVSIGVNMPPRSAMWTPISRLISESSMMA